MTAMLEVPCLTMHNSVENRLSSCRDCSTELPGQLPRQTGSTQTAKLEAVDQNTSKFFRTLIRQYKKQMGDANTNVCSGGLQQYLNKHRQGEDSQYVSVGQSQSQFENLPVNVRLHIYSYLTAKELCFVSQVCRSWYDLTQDNLLWQELLERDVHTWNVIGHNTNPSMYREVQSDWLNKDIYLRCSPELHQIILQQNSMFHSITNMLRYFMPRKCPKFAMFGPGLESSSRSLVRKIMYEDSDKLKRIGMFPGQFDGVGGGMTLQTITGQNFNLSVLYSSTKQEREKSQKDRMQRNKLVKESQGVESEEKYDLMPSVRDLCRTLDGFVYVADALDSQEAVKDNVDELVAMVSERWSATHVPVLVLSCIKDTTDPRVPCIDVVNRLDLAKLTRPWQVRNCAAETLDGFIEGLTWLVEQSQRRG